MFENENTLKKKILEEMTTDYSNNLEKNFGLAKQFIRVTKEGTVDILMKDQMSGKEQILLYLIGKMYAKEGGLASTDEVGNEELMAQLGVPIGSLLPSVKELRDSNKIKQVKREKRVYYTLPVNLIEHTLRSVEKKVQKK